MVNWVCSVVKKAKSAHFTEHPLGLTKEYDEARRALDDEIVAQCESEMKLMECGDISYKNSIFYGVMLLRDGCVNKDFKCLSEWGFDHVETALRLLSRADVQEMDP